MHVKPGTSLFMIGVTRSFLVFISGTKPAYECNHPVIAAVNVPLFVSVSVFRN